MATEIELVPDGKRVAWIKWVDGKPLGRGRFDPFASRTRAAAGHALGVDDQTLLEWVGKMETAKEPQRFPLPTAARSEAAAFVVRAFQQRRAEGVGHHVTPDAVVRGVLPTVAVDQVLDWSDRAALCCLDIDYHEIEAPPRPWLESLVRTRLAPRPIAWHFSRSGGLHLFYIATERFEAAELAAVAALRFRSVEPLAGVELKTQVRGPGPEVVHHADRQDAEGALTSWLGSAGNTSAESIDEAVKTYLSDRGFEIGQRYNHSHCPIDPTDDEGQSRDPVVVNDAGVHCFRCEGKGLSYGGSRRPGFIPWAILVDHPTGGDVGAMVRHLAHWGHARIVLQERYGLSGELARLAYSAALKAYHTGTDKTLLIPGVFEPATKDLAWAQPGGFWYRTDDNQAAVNVRDLVASMPAVQRVTEKGEIKSRLDMIALFQQPGKDLSAYGYPAVRTLPGAKVAGIHLSLPGPATVAVPDPRVRMKGAQYLPGYVPKGRRLPYEKAWAVIEQVVPRVNRSLIELLVAGAAVAQETDAGEPPRVFVVGPSGSAKSAHFGIAGSILGVESQSAKMDRNEERLYQAIRDALDQSPVVAVNEIFKDAARTNRLNPIGALQTILNFERGTRVHVMYRGSAPIGRQAMLGFTEITLPLTIRHETQLARRIRYVRLYGRKGEWKQTMAAAGCPNFASLRLVSPEVAAACNAILSDIADRFFDTHVRTFDQIAESLGVPTIETSGDFSDPTPYLKEFFRLVCAAPEVSDSRLRKMIHTGFKQISRGGGAASEEADDLHSLWTMFADGPGGDPWFQSEQLTSKDWAELLGVDDQVRLVTQRNGDSVFVRFQVGPQRNPLKVNEQIVNPSNWEPL